MALMKCPECGKEISDTVKKCPKCGMRIKKRMSDRFKPIEKKKIVIPIIIIVVIIGTVIGIHTLLSLNPTEQAEVVTLNNTISENLKVDIEKQTKTELILYREKCVEVEKEYQKLEWKQKRTVDNYMTLENRVEEVNKRITQLNSDEVNNVISLIDAIGDVSLESKETIEKAKKAYEELNEQQKEDVTNYEKIIGCEERYEEICVSHTIDLIKAIGKVTLENDAYTQIKNAEDSYTGLSTEEKNKVTNYDVLKGKRARYDELNRYKVLLEEAQDSIKSGELNAANRKVKKIPSSFKYKGIKASSLKRKLASKKVGFHYVDNGKQLVEICGLFKYGIMMDVGKIGIEKYPKGRKKSLFIAFC